MVKSVKTTTVTKAEVQDGEMLLSNGAFFEVRRRGREFRCAPKHVSHWLMGSESYRELAAELLAIADAMEGRVSETTGHAATAPRSFKVEMDGWPRFGLTNSGELAWFTSGGSGTLVAVSNASRRQPGFAFERYSYNPLPADGVLLKPEA